MIDLPDMPADTFTPESSTFSCVYGPAHSDFLAALGPIWSKKRCPAGPLGRGTQLPARFISQKMLPMLPDVFNYETSYKWDVDEAAVRRTTMVLDVSQPSAEHAPMFPRGLPNRAWSLCPMIAHEPRTSIKSRRFSRLDVITSIKRGKRLGLTRLAPFE